MELHLVFGRDVQSYLSQAYLFFATYSHKFLILVDNHSWRMHNNHSKSTHLRELFATKVIAFLLFPSLSRISVLGYIFLIVVFALTQYRTSPFKNSRALLRRVSARYKDNSISSNDERKKLYRWVTVVNSQRWRAKAFFSLVDLHVALHGFIVFEVRWEDIRGINYFSELQVWLARCLAYGVFWAFWFHLQVVFELRVLIGRNFLTSFDKGMVCLCCFLPALDLIKLLWTGCSEYESLSSYPLYHVHKSLIRSREG